MAFRAPRVVVGLVGCFIVFACSSESNAQQFVDNTSTRFPVPNPVDWTNQLTIGDLDNDGDLDVIFANGGNFSSAGTNQVQRVYINNGSGVFTDESTARLGFSGLCRGVELGDIENDGDLDIVFAQDFNRRPQLFRNDGSGVFTNVSTAQLPAISLSSSRGNFGDIDNDGDLDLYFVNGGSVSRFGSGQSKVYVNDGLGFFTDQTSTHHPIAVYSEPMDCIFGDIDGDYDLDIRTANRSGNSKLLRNNGLGVYTLVTTGIPSDTNCYSYDFGDINGDGDLDLLGANAGVSNAELMLSNSGSGVFTNVSSQIAPNPTFDDNDSKFFDYDNDGDLDLIIARLGGLDRIYRNNGTGSFAEVTGLMTAVTDSSLDVKVADVNNDGKLDIITGQGESGNFQNRIYINNTGPADTIVPRIVNTEQLVDTNNGVGPYVVRVAVLDGMTSDRNFFDKGVELNYSIDGGAATVVPMRYSGGQVYRGVIPGQPCGGTVSYFVTARDWANNLGIGLPRTFVITPPTPPQFDFGVGGAPSQIPPCTAIPFEVNIQLACFGQLMPGSAMLHYTLGLDTSSVALTAISETLHGGSLPATPCGAAASYYLSAMTQTGSTVYFPAGAPATPQVLTIGAPAPQPIFVEDFETGLPGDWQATALWNVTSDCAVAPVCDGLSWAYCGDASLCNYDMGATDSRLTAPAIVLPASSNISLSYCSTFQRDPAGTTDWPTLLLNGEIVDAPATGNLASSPWETRTVNLSAFSGQNVTLEWRFDTTDEIANALLGWQIDDVVVTALLPACDSSAFLGDWNGDDAIDGSDVQPFTDALLAGASDTASLCTGDYTGDGMLTMDDIPPFAEALVAE